ncbi:AAA family ATPase [Haliangium sp.]|uniref:AAA family ATPase n=1 Tax=Haliangium sp. TaxID=2663208 RepID=UPI003D0BB8FE
MPVQLPIGIDDFRKLRTRGLAYVDKSQMICDLIDLQGVEVLLLPRPRRFGKSLNLSMLRCFFERSDEVLGHLFEDLTVWSAGPEYRSHFQRYPVIYLDFKGIKPDTFEACRTRLRKHIQVLFDRHQAVLDRPDVTEREARDYRAVLDGSAGDEVFERALLDLSALLHRATGEPVVVLIDEYDAPIHAGCLGGYANEVIAFFRAFMTEGLKSNPHLHRAVLTGILRVARESIFSGLNNLSVCSVLEPSFADAFGFTEPEVQDLLTLVDASEHLPTVQRWYNGYVFGSHVIYNPWSVLSFLQWGRQPKPYWLTTSANRLIEQVLGVHATRLQPDFEALLAGGGLERVIDENVVLDVLERSERALWSLLLLSGYLKAEPCGVTDTGRPKHRLSIPNQEVRLVYTETFRQWMQDRMRGHGGSLDALTSALLDGDAPGVERELQALAVDLVSYHDTGGTRPESFYQGFVIGLLAVMEETHLVRSNRESGTGRPDVMIRPRQPGRPGVVLELKVARGGATALDAALDAAAAQIAEHGYDAELRAAGAVPVHAFAVAFDGKVVRVRAVDDWRDH